MQTASLQSCDCVFQFLGCIAMPSIETRTVIKNGKPEIRHRVKVRLRGKPPMSATFQRLTDAKQWAQMTEADLRRRRHFPVYETEQHTVAEAIDRYTETVLPTISSRRLFRAQLTWWRSRVGHLHLSALTAAEIVLQRDRLLVQGAENKGAISGSTANRYVAALSVVLNRAQREWEWLESSPIRRVKRLREPRGRTRMLSADELDRLLNACAASPNRHLRLIVLLALGTGARKAEILNLQLADVDLERSRLLFRRTKNGSQRAAYLSGLLPQLVAAHVEPLPAPEALLFPSPRRPKQPIALQCSWQKAVKAAGLADFRFHDLRHTAASYLAMSGATTGDIAAVLGHKTLAMVQRYSHLTEAHQQEVTSRMAEKFLPAPEAQ